MLSMLTDWTVHGVCWNRFDQCVVVFCWHCLWIERTSNESIINTIVPAQEWNYEIRFGHDSLLRTSQSLPIAELRIPQIRRSCSSGNCLLLWAETEEKIIHFETRIGGSFRQYSNFFGAQKIKKSSFFYSRFLLHNTSIAVLCYVNGRLAEIKLL